MRKLMSVRSLLLALVVFLVPAASFAQVSVGVSVRVGPPILPVYAQPVCPGEGYIWTPGYWGWGGGVYVFHAGYWGPHVGFSGRRAIGAGAEACMYSMPAIGAPT